jgi:hypothetical protein
LFSCLGFVTSPCMAFASSCPEVSPPQIAPFSDSTSSDTPLKSAWSHARKKMAGNPKTEIIKETPSALEILITIGSERIIYVFLLDQVRGSKATVHAGLKDAGVDTIYHLEKKDGSWAVKSVEETDF